MRISDWSSDVCSSDLRLPKRCLNPFRNIRRDVEIRCLEGAGKSALQLAFFKGSLKNFAVHADPYASSRRTATYVGRALTVRSKRQPDRPLADFTFSRKDAATGVGSHVPHPGRGRAGCRRLRPKRRRWKMEVPATW